MEKLDIKLEMVARSANPCPALGGGGDRHILVIFLILWGMILRFLISGCCYTQTHAYSTHFLQIFLDDLFFACQAFFTHFFVKIA